MVVEGGAESAKGAIALWMRNLKVSMHTRQEKDQSSRPPLDRMLRIHQELQANKYPNAAGLSRTLEVNPKTVHRDLDFMRYRLNLPIEYDPQRFGFFYTEKVSAFPSLQITEGELVALVLAEKALQQYRGTSFEQPLLSALKKIEQSLPATISVSLSDVQQTISFRTSTEPVVDLQVFDTLAKATADRKQLEVSYRKPGQKEAEQRVIDPYHLANINGEWYLFAYDHLRRDIRTFVPMRIKTLRETGKTFERPEQFSVHSRLRKSFAVHSAEGDYDVLIRFSPRVADYVRERRWHDSQRVTEKRDGSLDLRLNLSSLREVERWVLSWGGEAVVIRPRELAESVRSAARNLMENHSSA